jgi:hypothetical protein
MLLARLCINTGSEDAKSSLVRLRRIVGCNANSRNGLVYSTGECGNAAMDMAIRDLTTDELERVVGGDAPHGAGCATEEDTCVGWKDGFGMVGFIHFFPC